MIELRAVTRTFALEEGEVQALRGVNLTVRDGEFVAIEGESGGGKSTVLNIIGLLDAPTTGHYFYNGVDVAQLSERKRAEYRSSDFAYIFQNFHLLDSRQVADSVGLGLMYRGVPRSRRRTVAERALSTVGLDGRGQQSAGTLSGGQRQRVAIARALASRSKVVIADEPTGNLDSENAARVVDELVALNNAGHTVVLVTHSAEVAAAASRRVRIRDGAVISDSAAGSASRVPGGGVEQEIESESPDKGSPATLRYRDLFWDALLSLKTRARRAVGLAVTVALGVGLAVATLGVSASASAQVSSSFDEHASRDVSVTWTGDASDALAALDPAEYLSRLAASQSIAAATTVEYYGATTVNAGEYRGVREVDDFGAVGALERAGRLDIDWAPGADRTLRSGVLVGSSLAAQLGLGDVDQGARLIVGDTTYPVSGYITASPRMPALVGAVVQPRTAGRSVNQTDVLVLSETGGAATAADRAPYLIDPFHPDAFTVTAPADPSTLRASVEGDVQLTLMSLTLLAIIASAVALANAMVMAVAERHGEFGLRRALGARSRHVASLVLAESGVLGLAGGLVGLVGGFTVILALTLAQHWRPVFDLGLAPLALALGVVVGALGGIFAAMRASKIAPHAALRAA